MGNGEGEQVYQRVRISIQGGITTFNESSEKIHILENGKIAFSKEAVSDLYPHHYIDLYYDPDEKKIKLEPLNDYGSDSSFRLKGLFNLYIAAKDFFEHFEIPISGGKYDYTLDHGMLIVQL